MRADSESAEQAGGVGEEEAEVSVLPDTQAQLLAGGADSELVEPPVSGEGGEQSPAGEGMSGENISHDMSSIRETLQSLENNILCQSIGSISSSSDISKVDANNLLSTSQEQKSLTLSVTGDDSSMENSNIKISPIIQEKVEKFENDEVKRKAEFSPELSKKEKKKQKNKEKYLKSKRKRST